VTVNKVVPGSGVKGLRGRKHNCSHFIGFRDAGLLRVEIIMYICMSFIFLPISIPTLKHFAPPCLVLDSRDAAPLLHPGRGGEGDFI
jgi:hypothetical protein